jgi:hypothetical protein
VAGEPKPQIDIHKAVSRLFFCLFFSSFDETMTERGLHAKGLTESVLDLNWGFFVLVWFWFFLVFFPFHETMTELLLRHQHQDWTLKD